MGAIPLLRQAIMTALCRDTVLLRPPCYGALDVCESNDLLLLLRYHKNMMDGCMCLSPYKLSTSLLFWIFFRLFSSKQQQLAAAAARRTEEVNDHGSFCLSAPVVNAHQVSSRKTAHSTTCYYTTTARWHEDALDKNTIYLVLDTWNHRIGGM